MQIVHTELHQKKQQSTSIIIWTQTLTNCIPLLQYVFVSGDNFSNVTFIVEGILKHFV